MNNNDFHDRDAMISAKEDKNISTTATTKTEQLSPEL